jgi:putative transposase
MRAHLTPPRRGHRPRRIRPGHEHPDRPDLQITIESLNYQLRKIIKNRGHFPSDEAVIKLLWLAIRDIEDKRARERAKEKGVPANKRKAPSRLVEGAIVPGWKQALNALTIAYPGRLPAYVN